VLNTLSFELKLLNRFRYSEGDWFFARLITGAAWLYFMVAVLHHPHYHAIPDGICKFFNCSPLLQGPLSTAVLWMAVILAVLYIWGKFLPGVTLLLVIAGTLVFSADKFEYHHRYGLFTLIFLVQFIAFLRYHFASPACKKATPFRNLAMFYSVQIVATAYVIAGLSKLRISGLHWVTGASNTSVRVIRECNLHALATGNFEIAQTGRAIARFMLHYPHITAVIFAFALGVELCTFVAMFGRKYARYYAVLLLLIHAGFFLLFNIIITSFLVVLTAYFVNLKPMPEESTESDSRIQLSLCSLLNYAWQFKPAIILFVLTFLIGENHPFSRYALFSSAAPEADYFYFTGQDNMPVSSEKNFGISGTQIKNMIGEQAAKHGTQEISNQNLKEPAAEFLEFVVNSKRRNAIEKHFNELKLFHHEIAVRGDSIVETDTLLAARLLKP
jgi:hypothetical protein